MVNFTSNTYTLKREILTFSRKISRHLSSFNCSLLIFHYSIHIRMRLKSSSGNPTALPPVFSHHILSEIFKNKECLRHVTSWYFSSSPFPTIRCRDAAGKVGGTFCGDVIDVLSVGNGVVTLVVRGGGFGCLHGDH